MSNGMVVAWGDNSQGECNGPPPAPGASYLQLAAHNHSLAVASDGSVVAWGLIGFMPPMVPAPPPGMGYAEIAAGTSHSAARIGVLSTYVTFGSGCPGSLGTSTLSPAGSLRPGGTLTVTVDRLPQGFALLLSGFSDTVSVFGALPLHLASFGMPGCFGRVSPDLSLTSGGAGTVATFTLTVPNQPALVGITIYQQALVPDPAVGNPAGLVVSDAARATVGI